MSTWSCPIDALGHRAAPYFLYNELMVKYVALLRGIAPMNPQMRNEKLRQVFEELGYANVRTVISSGNVVFESPRHDVAAMQEEIEQAWPEKLGFRSTTSIRSQRQLQELASVRPFGPAAHSPRHYLTVTFTKRALRPRLPRPDNPRGYHVAGIYDGAVCCVVDLTSSKTPNLMVWLEKHLGKEITTRTWQTVQRILSVME